MKKYKVEYEFIDCPILKDGEEYLKESEIKDYIIYSTFREVTGVDIIEKTLKVEEINNESK